MYLLTLDDLTVIKLHSKMNSLKNDHLAMRGCVFLPTVRGRMSAIEQTTKQDEYDN